MFAPDATASLSAAPFPWRRPRRERLILILVALATLTQVSVVTTQDVSRLCLTRALTVGRLTITRCDGDSLDHARYHGRVYSDKAPGMSLLAVPAARLVGLPGSHRSEFHHDLGVWVVRVLTNGVAFLALVFVLGRIAEGLAAGTGGPVAVTFALGTIGGALASTMFDQVAAAALGFGSFAFAWRRRPALAGLLAGVAVLVEYEAAPIVAIVALYVLLTAPRGFWRFCLGAVPGLAVLGAYDWAAFGSPFHLSYRYVANVFSQAQASGFFGISLPRWQAVSSVLAGDRGVLVTSPALVLAAAGLMLLGRRYRLEMLVCAAATAVGLLLEFGYFLPYGGVSPGPRFLAPALPFLALGLAPAFARARLLTSSLMLASVVASTAVLLTWANESVAGYRQTVWGELARTLTHTHSRLHSDLTRNIVWWAGLDKVECAVFVAACAAAACAAALAPRAQLRSRRPAPVRPLEPTVETPT